MNGLSPNGSVEKYILVAQRVRTCHLRWYSRKCCSAEVNNYFKMLDWNPGVAGSSGKI
jgi:hypothetical protein